MPSKPIPGQESLLASAVRLHRQSRFDPALDHYQTILDTSPDDHKVLHLAGHAFLGRRLPGDLDAAIDHLRRAVDLDDSIAAYHNDLGTALWVQRNLLDASQSFRHALTLDSSLVQARFNLGNCHWMLGELESALEQYRLTAALNDKWLQAHYMQANCLYALGRPAEALRLYDLALAHPRWGAEARIGKAAALLKLGRWQEAWPLFDTRLATGQLQAYRASVRPEWQGETDPECTLLIYAEQGIGDLIMLARFLPEVRLRVGKLLLACDPTVHRLFARLPCVDGLVDKSVAEDNLDSSIFDKRVAVMSLTRIFGIEADSIPADIPYLTCDRTEVKSWQDRLATDSLNVGLVWAGNPNQKDDMFRSCPAREYGAFSTVSDVQFYSLQKGKAREQLGEVRLPGLIDLADELNDFDSTASLICALDLVITVDTAVAHLAGALGCPVWTLLWPGHCWRYLTGRNDTPWYPTMRLFSQSPDRDWSAVVARVGKELELQLPVQRTGDLKSG